MAVSFVIWTNTQRHGAARTAVSNCAITNIIAARLARRQRRVQIFHQILHIFHSN